MYKEMPQDFVATENQNSALTMNNVSLINMISPSDQDISLPTDLSKKHIDGHVQRPVYQGKILY